MDWELEGIFAFTFSRLLVSNGLHEDWLAFASGAGFGSGFFSDSIIAFPGDAFSLLPDFRRSLDLSLMAGAVATLVIVI